MLLLPLPDPLPGVPRPLSCDGGLRCVGAYTVSLSGDELRELGCACATLALSCRNHRSRARREAASTSDEASGTGICALAMSWHVTHLDHDVVGRVRAVAGADTLTLNAQVPVVSRALQEGSPRWTDGAVKPRPNNILQAADVS